MTNKKENFINQGLLVLLAFAVLSCADEKGYTKDAESTPVSLTTTEMEVENKPVEGPQEVYGINASSLESLELETFSTYSDDLDGCGCSLFRKEQEKQKQDYIYLDAGNIAMIKLNGVVHTLNYKGEKNGVTTYSDDSVEIERRITRTVESTEMEETVNVEGVLSVVKNKEKLEQKFIGFCGC